MNRKKGNSNALFRTVSFSKNQQDIGRTYWYQRPDMPHRQLEQPSAATLGGFCGYGSWNLRSFDVREGAAVGG